MKSFPRPAYSVLLRQRASPGYLMSTQRKQGQECMKTCQIFRPKLTFWKKKCKALVAIFWFKWAVERCSIHVLYKFLPLGWLFKLFYAFDWARWPFAVAFVRSRRMKLTSLAARRLESSDQGFFFFFQNGHFCPTGSCGGRDKRPCKGLWTTKLSWQVQLTFYFPFWNES